MPGYWWVNHKQTARQEIAGQYLWSPKTNSNGARNRFYDNMRSATPADLVLSYADGIIRYVGRAAEFAFTAPKPAEFGNAGANWNDEGWLLPVFWTPIEPPVRTRDIIAQLGPLLPSKYSRTGTSGLSRIPSQRRVRELNHVPGRGRPCPRLDGNRDQFTSRGEIHAGKDRRALHALSPDCAPRPAALASAVRESVAPVTPRRDLGHASRDHGGGSP
jgi:hypothetical protein